MKYLLGLKGSLVTVEVVEENSVGGVGILINLQGVDINGLLTGNCPWWYQFSSTISIELFVKFNLLRWAVS